MPHSIPLTPGNNPGTSSQATLTFAALDHLDQGITVFNRKLELITWNLRFAELLDLPGHLLYFGAPFEALIRYNAQRGEYGDGDYEELIAERVRLARAFQPHRIERVRPDGTVLEIHGNPIDNNNGFVTVYTDITQRRKAELELKENKDTLEQRVLERTYEIRATNKRLANEINAHKETSLALKENESWIRQIADAVPALIAYVDADQRYMFLNKKHEEWFGLSPRDLIGQPFIEVVEPRHAESLRQDVRSALVGEEIHREYDLRDRRGRSLHFSISLIPHIGDRNEILGFFFLGQDLTEYKQAQSTLIEVQKMQAVGQLTGGVAHDFNNLLTIIMGNLTLIEDELIDTGGMAEIVESSMHAAQRGSELISRLLAFSRRQPLQTKVTDINQLVTETSRLLNRTLGEATDIDLNLSQNLWSVSVDPGQLSNALVNLAINARDAMPDGGVLTISSENYTHASHTRNTPTELKPGKYVLLQVNDNGTGMTRSVMDRVFEPFFTTKEVGQGNGLGLSMVYGFAKQSGGLADISSRMRRGTRVRLFLPATTMLKPAPPNPDIGGNNAQRGIDGQEAVLLVEDDPDVRHYVQRALSELGYRVRVAENGEAAMAVIENEDIDLLLTDLVMPGKVKGEDLAKFVTDIKPGVKVMYMSGHADKLAQGEYSLNPDFVLLQKPFGKADLARALRDVLDDNPG